MAEGEVQGPAETIKQHIDAAIRQLEDHRQVIALQGPEVDRGGRDVSLAITALEDAKLRATRGLCKELGVFNEIDVQVDVGLQRARDNHAANVHDYSAGSIQRS